MQIGKINENQLEVILNLVDLKENNISLHSFMCNSEKNQDLFFYILNLANKKIGFNFKNHELIIESFFLPIKKIFILLITCVPKTAYLHISKTKYGTFKASKSFWLKFNSFEDFCMFCASMKTSQNLNSSLYLLGNNYYLHIKFHRIKNLYKILALASEFANYIYDNNYVLDENANSILKNNAIKTCKKYFI